MSRRERTAWILCCVLLVPVGLILFQFRSGIRITVQNAGVKSVRSVVLYVTGESRPVGDIAPGHVVEATVNPSSESHLEIEYRDADGKQQRLKVDCYFEPGYRGMMAVSINNGHIGTVEQQIHSRGWW